VKFGECFGEGAVTRPKGEEARGATAVALADVVLLTLRKWKYDAILGVVEASAAQKTREFLRTTDLFPRDRVSDADLLALAEKLTATRVAPGDVVVKSGDAPKGVFFIVSGTARVYARSATYVDGVYLDGRGSARSSSSAPWAGIDREPLALRKNTGRGGGAIRDGDPRLGKVTEIALGVLSTPALFGEECLAPRAKDEGSEGVGTHLFTVKAGGGGEEETKSERLLHALRLDPEDARGLPPSVSRRLRSLAKSTAAAAREAHDALKATPPEAMVDGGNDENAPAPARAARRASGGGGGGGSKSAPTTPALRPSGSGSGTRRSPRDFRRSSGDRIPIGVGLGGGGGRLREVGRRAEERIERRRGGTTTPTTTTPTRSEPGRRRDRDGDRRARVGPLRVHRRGPGRRGGRRRPRRHRRCAVRATGVLASADDGEREAGEVSVAQDAKQRDAGAGGAGAGAELARALRRSRARRPNDEESRRDGGEEPTDRALGERAAVRRRRRIGRVGAGAGAEEPRRRRRGSCGVRSTADRARGVRAGDERGRRRCPRRRRQRRRERGVHVRALECGRRGVSGCISLGKVGSIKFDLKKSILVRVSWTLY
jgi:CRP-like cAMP-binding protein